MFTNVGASDAVVDRAEVVVHSDEAQQEHTGQAKEEADACVGVALERGDRGIARLDVHGLHDEQVVVE